MAENKRLYESLQRDGFILSFKPVLYTKKKKPKGNVDADLVLHAMVDLDSYEKAVICASDGDYYSLVEHLAKKGKLEKVVAADRENCSALLLKTAKSKIDFLEDLRGKLGGGILHSTLDCL